MDEFGVDVQPAGTGDPPADGYAGDWIENDFVETDPATGDAVEEGPRFVGRRPDEEPEVVKKWRSDQRRNIEEKDSLEEKMKSELRETAKRQLEDWYKAKGETLVNARASNRSRVEEVEEVIESDNRWERIAALCDLDPKPNFGDRKDVTRMKSIIIQLKQGVKPTRVTING